MKTFWEVLGIIFTVVAVASMVAIIVEMARAWDQITFSQALQTIGVPASLLATVCVLWAIRYQHGETKTTLNEIAMSVAPEDIEALECLPETQEEPKGTGNYYGSVFKTTDEEPKEEKHEEPKEETQEKTDS